MKSDSSHRRSRQGIPLVWLAIILLFFAGCSLLIPQPQSLPTVISATGSMIDSVTGSQKTTKHSATVTSGKTGMTSAVSVPMTTVTDSGSNASSTVGKTQTTGTIGTIQPTISNTTAASRPELNALSVAPLSWYYTVPKPLNSGVRATIPASVTKLTAPYPIIWQMKPTGRPTVYLTMDEGYEYNAHTTKILDIARGKSVKIAFFITGSYLRNHTDLVVRMLNEGHMVLNHSDLHPNLAIMLRDQGAAAVLADIRKLESDFLALTGKVMPRLIRLPAGAYSERLLALLDREQYRVVFWSFAYRDWLTAAQPTLTSARDAILGQLHDGQVLLLHAVSDTNVELLPEVIDAIVAKGYRFGLISEPG